MHDPPVAARIHSSIASISRHSNASQSFRSPAGHQSSVELAPRSDYRV